MARHFVAAVVALILLFLPCYAVYRYGLDMQWVYVAAFFNATFFLTLIFLSWMNSRAYWKTVERIKPRGLSEKALRKPDLETLVKVAGDLKKAGMSEEFIEDVLFGRPSVLDKGEVRRAITISLFVVYLTLLAYSLYTPIHLDGMTLLLSVVVAFYFGSRAVESGIGLYRARGARSSAEVKGSFEPPSEGRRGETEAGITVKTTEGMERAEKGEKGAEKGEEKTSTGIRLQ